jgi:hypothetical protein
MRAGYIMQSQETGEVIAKLKEERDRWKAACKALVEVIVDVGPHGDGGFTGGFIDELQTMQIGDLEALEKALGIGEK